MESNEDTEYYEFTMQNIQEMKESVKGIRELKQKLMNSVQLGAMKEELEVTGSGVKTRRPDTPTIRVINELFNGEISGVDMMLRHRERMKESKRKDDSGDGSEIEQDKDKMRAAMAAELIKMSEAFRGINNAKMVASSNFTPSEDEVKNNGEEE